MVIGLDAADAELIDRWCQEDYLPNLNSLRQQGTWGNLETTAEVMHVSAWPSIYTGTLPGKHGMYHAYQISPGEQDVHRTRADECAQPPFWKFLDDAGKRCIIMDAFMNYPIEGFKGLQILEWGTWTWFSEQQATPDGLWRKIISEFGPYPAPEHSKVLGMPKSKSFRQQLIEGANLKSKVVRWLMKKHPWDIFFVTFGEPHPAGHYLWHLSDPEYPAYPLAGVNGSEKAVRDVYVAVDKAIGEILNELDDNVNVFVTSGDGMGPNYAGCHLLPEVLTRLGLYKELGDGQVSGKNTAQTTGSRKSLTKIVRDLVPLSVRRTISRCMPRHMQHQLSMKWANANIDWEKTKAFCIPNANEGYIRMNLQGREPMGLIPAGTAYEELCTEIQARCSELINPQNGRIASRQVVCSHEIYKGERLSYLPDIVVNWDNNAKVLTQLYSERCGQIEGPAAGYQTAPYYTGNHKPTAFFIARGPKFKVLDVFKGGHIIDLAPTLIAMMGVEIPEHFDGKVWEELI